VSIAKKKKPASAKPARKRKPRTLAERLAKVIGTATGTPPDASVNHDHYLYGAPKQQ
jgi:chromatin remodeling complex protein RSC6